jgi:hypothetical protein
VSFAAADWDENSGGNFFFIPNGALDAGSAPCVGGLASLA